MIANALFYFADAKLVQLGSVVCEVMFLAIGVYPLMGWCDAMRNWIDLLLNMKLGRYYASGCTAKVLGGLHDN